MSFEKTFESNAAFNDYVNEHKEEFDGKSTCALNRLYKIPGYRISRDKGELKLKKDYYHYIPIKDLPLLEELKRNKNSTECGNAI
jgi:hypothetical protein